MKGFLIFVHCFLIITLYTLKIECALNPSDDDKSLLSAVADQPSGTNCDNKKPSEKNEVPSNSKLNPEPVIEAAPSPQPASVKSASVNGVNKQTIGGGMVPPQNGPLPVAPQQLPLLPQQQMPMPTYSYPFSPFPSPLYPNGVIYPNVPSTPSAGNTNGTPVTGPFISDGASLSSGGAATGVGKLENEQVQTGETKPVQRQAFAEPFGAGAAIPGAIPGLGVQLPGLPVPGMGLGMGIPASSFNGLTGVNGNGINGLPPCTVHMNLSPTPTYTGFHNGIGCQVGSATFTPSGLGSCSSFLQTFPNCEVKQGMPGMGFGLPNLSGNGIGTYPSAFGLNGGGLGSVPSLFPAGIPPVNPLSPVNPLLGFGVGKRK